MGTVVIDLLEYWHVGSGARHGDRLSVAAHRHPASSLPSVPARTLHGLLREAVQQAEDYERVPPGATIWLFGSRPRTVNRFATRSGRLEIDDAELDGSLASQLSDRDAQKQLFRRFEQTQIVHGVADEDTLRSTEVVVPMRLHAPFDVTGSSDWPFDTAFRVVLERSACYLRAVGRGRRRGLGRCRARFCFAATVDEPHERQS